MKRRISSSTNSYYRNGHDENSDKCDNIKTKPPRIYDNITKRLIKFGLTLSLTTFIGLLIRYAVQEFDPSMSAITVTTLKVDDNDIASLNVSKHFVERILGIVEESIAIIATVLPIGFPLCTFFNKKFAKQRCSSRLVFKSSSAIFNLIPKYIIIGDSQVLTSNTSSNSSSFINDDNNDLGTTTPGETRTSQYKTTFRPLVRDTLYHLEKLRLKPKLVIEEPYEEARAIGLKLGLLARDHNPFAIIKSIDLLKNITDESGDISVGKVRLLLSKMKIMAQSTPADKSLLMYLIKKCEDAPNDGVIYLGNNLTDIDAMAMADCAIAFEQGDVEIDVKKAANLLITNNTDNELNFVGLFLATSIFQIYNNVTQSFALYQISACICACLYRFMSIMIFQEQILSRSELAILLFMQQIFVTVSLMTKWVASMPRQSLSWAHTQSTLNSRTITTELSMANSPMRSRSRSCSGSRNTRNRTRNKTRHSSHLVNGTLMENKSINEHNGEISNQRKPRSSLLSPSLSNHGQASGSTSSSSSLTDLDLEAATWQKNKNPVSGNEQIKRPLDIVDLNATVANTNLVSRYKQTFRRSKLIDDVNLKLTKLHVCYQLLVLLIIMIFGNSMFQFNVSSEQQHQTLALNCFLMLNMFNSINCFNQFGCLNIKKGLRNNPFFLCILVLSIFIQVALTEFNAFGLQNMNPGQWFFCFTFAFLGNLIAPITGQQQKRYRQQVQVSRQSTNLPDASRRESSVFAINSTSIDRKDVHRKSLSKSKSQSRSHSRIGN